MKAEDEDESLEDPSRELAERIAYLINGFNRKHLTRSEHLELDEWISASMKNQQLFEELTDPDNINKWIEWRKRLDTDAALERVKVKLGMDPGARQTPGKRFWLFMTLAAAAVVGIILGLFWFQKPVISEKPVAVVHQDLMPGGKHATLQLNNGQIIVLDTMASGKFTPEAEIQISKDSAQLTYAVLSENISVKSDVLSTPAGGEYEVKLSDGTKVWLNASSSLKYPEQFSGPVRKVELTGEAYFEVSKDAKHPFVVSAGNNEVRVLGTHFDINNYADNKHMIVTLAEGSVKLNGSVLLKPGEEGLINQEGEIRTGPADLESALAWKDGLFIFKMAPLDEVLRQVSHWYDARIVYKANNTEHFNARIPRNVPVSKLLFLLEATGRVHFKIEDKTITVIN